MNKEKLYNDYMIYVKSLVEKGIRPKNKAEYKKLKSKGSNEYFEFHHIIPKSCGGDDTENNIIPLTAREHVLAHLTLCDIYATGPNHFKMLNALQMLIGTRNIDNRYSDSLRLLCNSKAIAKKLEERAKLNSEFMTGFKFGEEFRVKQRAIQSNRTKEWKDNISDSKKGIKNPNFGKKWFNNGTESKQLYECPEGWVEGRLCNSNIAKCRKVIDVDSGILFDCVEDAADYFNVSKSNLSGNLNHKIGSCIYNIKYYDEDIEVFSKEDLEIAKNAAKTNKSKFKQFTEDQVNSNITSNIIKKFKTFPFESYTNKELLHDYDLLLNNSSIGKNGNKLVGEFHKSIYKDHCANYKSSYEAWHDYDIMKKCIHNRFEYLDKDKISAKDLRRGLTVSKMGPHPSVFQPSYAKYLINKYLGNYDTIFDPFSGYSGRLLGAIACNKKYIGQDIDHTHVQESNELINYLKNKNASVIEKDIFESSGEYDCLFTCSPYNLKETWGTELKDLSCDEWIDECLKRFKCKKYLFVVDNTEKYKDNIVEYKNNTSHFSKNSEKVILI